MYQRKDGRFCEKITLPTGKTKYFYSSEREKAKAERDIKKQVLDFENKDHTQKHNFKALADAMLKEKEKQVSYATYQTYYFATKHLDCFFEIKIRKKG